MKIIRNILITVMLIGIVIEGIFVKNGYDMYKNAIEKMPIEVKISSIKEKIYTLHKKKQIRY